MKRQMTVCTPGVLVFLALALALSWPAYTPAREAMGNRLARGEPPRQKNAETAKAAPAKPAKEKAEAKKPRARPDRAAALRALCAKLGVGAGAIVADIGCGRGRDSLVFAEVVGAAGAVFSEEIRADSLKAVLDGSVKAKLPQVIPVLGESHDPHLPDGRVDLVYMHFVFHHFRDPRSMLRNLWRDLSPGGHLAIVDREKGPMRDCVPLEERETKHHWTGETAVVRMAREEGFAFVGLMDDLWGEKDAFVLVFQRPDGTADPAGDPQAPLPLDAAKLRAALSSLRRGASPQAAVVVALDAGRAVLPVVRELVPAPDPLYDVVLEEWRVFPGEMPAGCLDGAKIVRTEKGRLSLPEGPDTGLVVFADSYHRLWDAAPVLEDLRRRMRPDGRVVILDRRGPDEPRREAGHRRRISPALVRSEMEKAGFRFEAEGEAPAADRFLLVFTPAASKKPSGAGERKF